MNETITQQAQKVGERIASTSCILEIHVRQPGFRKKMNSYEFLHMSGNQQNMHADVLTVSKDLIQRKDIEYLERQRREFLDSIRRLSVPAEGLKLGNGQFLIPLASVEKVRDLISEYEGARQKFLDRFESEYVALKEKAKIKLGGFFNPHEFPEFKYIRNRYTIDHKFISNSVPEELAKASARIKKEEEAKVRLEFAKHSIELQEIMRLSFAHYVEGLKEKLGRNPSTGKFYQLPEIKLNALRDFIEEFNNKNLVGDKELKALVEKGREALTGVSPLEIKNNEELRDRITSVFDEIHEETQPLIKGVTRRINVEGLG